MLSNLTAEQKNSLQTMQAVLGLAADMAHGMVTIYLPCEDKKFLQVYKQEQPRTQKGSVRPDMTGRRVRGGTLREKYPVFEPLSPFLGLY